MNSDSLAVAILLSSIAWSFVLLAIAVMADRQVSRIIGNREEKDLDKRIDLVEERLGEQLHSFDERLAETQQSANAAAVAVGLSPNDRRK